MMSGMLNVDDILLVGVVGPFVVGDSMCGIGGGVGWFVAVGL